MQALWTQARESLNVVNLILSNRSYRILNIELQRVGAEAAGERARSLLDIGRPDLDFVALSRAMGVPAVRVETRRSADQGARARRARAGPVHDRSHDAARVTAVSAASARRDGAALRCNDPRAL